MQRERALFIAIPENLKYLSADYQRVYFGDEFCERLLPSPPILKDIMDQVAERGCAFTLVTPYVTQTGLAAVEKLLDILPTGTEVVFNDWGVFRVMKNRYPHLKPVLGRLMTKIKRGPRIMNFLDRLPPDALRHLRSTNLGVPHYVRFLLEQGIERAELDNPLHGLDISDVPQELHLSLHIPFVYVTTTRFCLVANCDNPEKKGFIGVFPCGKECRTYTFYLDNAVMTTLLIRRGNTIFYKNTTVPDQLKTSPIDRVIISPEIPH
ncbi:MAG: hypothetical protein N3B18_03990 [Desulfobacterota bacterium]|nr:hypothetical protein [Thermodesulfobacteriota bacterium]